MFDTTDETLITKALTGNKRAWGQLLSRYEKPVYLYGVRMTSNREDAKDLMQDVFISVYRNLGQYQGTGKFKSWLFKIAHYRCIEFYRRKKPLQSIDDTLEIPDSNATPDMCYAGDAQQQTLLLAMQGLPFAQREVVELKFFGQFTFVEIAEQLHVSPNTVKARLYSALAKLKDNSEVQYAYSR